MLKMKPLADRVIIEPTPAEEKSAGGIIIPDTAKEKPKTGKVVAVGKGKEWDDNGGDNGLGGVIPLTVKEGDTVLFGQYAGQEITEDGKEYLIMREDDILAIV